MNPAGVMAEKWWYESENKFPTPALGAHVVMPNHFHGIVQIAGVDLRVDPETGEKTTGGHASGGYAGPPLLTIVQWFKTMTTNECVRGVKQLG